MGQGLVKGYRQQTLRFEARHELWKGLGRRLRYGTEAANCNWTGIKAFYNIGLGPDSVPKNVASFIVTADLHRLK